VGQGRLAQHGHHLTRASSGWASSGFTATVIQVHGESAELGVVQGTEQALRRHRLRRHRPMLMVENNDWQRVAVLAAVGYACFRYLPEAQHLVSQFSGERERLLLASRREAQP
jgi:hypothetical protein